MAETHKLRTEDIEPKTNQYKLWNVEAEKLAKLCLSNASGPGPASVPSLVHLRMADYNNVYEPSDDTYLMLDALNWDFGSWNDSVNGNGNGSGNAVSEDTTGNRNIACKDENERNDDDEKNRITTLELGCGTGVNTVFLAQLLSQQQQQEGQRKKKLVHIVTDINKYAIQVTKRTAQQNITNISIDDDVDIDIDKDTDRIDDNQQQQFLQTHLCDLATPLLQSKKRQIDILIFNPPYVPTPDEEVGQFCDPQCESDVTSVSASIEASWAGGTNGRVVIDKSLPQIATLLSYPHGVAYMITVDDNQPEEIASIMRDNYGIIVKPFFRRRARNEFLTVLKMTYQ